MVSGGGRLLAGFSLTVERARGLSEPSFTRALIPFVRAPPSQSKCLPGAHVQTQLPSGLGSMCGFWGGHIQTVQPTSVPSEDGKRQSRESICRRRPRSTLSPALTFHAPGDPPRAARAITTLSWEHHTLSFLVTRPPAARNDTPGRCPWQLGSARTRAGKGAVIRFGVTYFTYRSPFLNGTPWFGKSKVRVSLSTLWIYFPLQRDRAPQFGG